MGKPVRTRSASYGAALSSSLAANGPSADYAAEVASIAVMDGDKILMGRRRDSGRWTLPGGHLEAGEDPHEGAIRELAEEAGIDAQQLNYLGSQGVITELGRAVMVHSYHLPARPDVTAKRDPDAEVSRWHWIDTRHGLPKRISENLHSKRNVTLMLLDIYRSFSAGLYITDLLKAGSHKYLRKYKGRTGEWIYVYHDGVGHGRVLHPDALQHLKELAELGHGDSHALVGSLEAHDETKLAHLRELSDMDHAPATEHLKSLGIDRAGERKKDKAEEIERSILGSNNLTKDLSGSDMVELHDAIEKGVKRDIIDHLTSHSGTPVGRAAAPTLAGLMSGVVGQRSVKGKLERLHENLKALDQATAGIPSARAEISQAGGYGNYAYNRVVHDLVNRGYLPAAAAELHKRTTANMTGPLTLPHRDLDSASRGLPERRAELREATRRQDAERAAIDERRRVEQSRSTEERDRVSSAERDAAYTKHAANVDAMIEAGVDLGGRPVSDAQKKTIAHGLSKLVGDDFNFTKWLGDVQHPDPRLKTHIHISFSQLMSAADGHATNASFSYKIVEASTNRVVVAPSRTMGRGRSGEIYVQNGTFPRVKASDRKKFPNLASAIYDGTEKMVKESSKNLSAHAKAESYVSIGCCANGGFTGNYAGAVVWAKHCYDWDSPADRRPRWQETWKQLIESEGPRLGITADEQNMLKAKVDTFQYPYQFVEMGYGLSAERMGSQINDDIKDVIAKKGSYDLGSWLMLRSGINWSAMNYVNQTDGRAGHLNQRREAKRQRTREGAPVGQAQGRARRQKPS